MGKGGELLYRKLEEEGGVDRAMNKIKELCTDPNGGCVFWSAGAQPPELLAVSYTHLTLPTNREV